MGLVVTMKLGELITMLRRGSIDFVGQKSAYYFMFYTMWTSGIIGFIYGYIHQRFLYTVNFIFTGCAIVVVLVLPAWPIWNSHPLPWLEPNPDDDDNAEGAEKDKDKDKEKEKAKHKVKAKDKKKTGRSGLE